MMKKTPQTIAIEKFARLKISEKAIKELVIR